MPAFSFEEPHSLWIFLAVSCLAVGLIVHFYRRAAGAVPRRTLLALVVLRAVAVALVIVLLFRPVVTLSSRGSARETLAVLIDRSRSMSIADHPNTPGRLEQVRASLSGGVLGRLEKDFEIEVWAFDGTAERLSRPRSAGDLAATGGSTDIAGALKAAAAAADRARLHGLILFTDGIDTAGGDTVAAARDSGLRVYCVGVGARLVGEKDFKDVRISRVETKRSCPVDNVTEVTVLVEAVGLKGLQVPVSVVKGGSEIARTTVQLDNVPGAQPVTVRFAPKEKGLIEYRALIPVQPDERIGENNEQTFVLNVTDPRVRVLYVAGSVGPDYKFLSRLLRLDPNVEPMCFVKVRQGLIKQQGEIEGVAEAELPSAPEAFERFDVILLEDIDASHFSAAQMSAMASRVSAGAGLAMLRGPASFGAGGYAGTPLAEALPVALGARGEPERTGSFRMELTDAGKVHPVFAGLTPLFEDAKDGVKLDVLSRLGAPRPGAEVLATGPEEAGARAAVLVVSQFGKGRTAAFAGGPTFRWLLAYKGAGRESPYTRFWGQLIRWLASAEVKESLAGPGVEASLDAGVCSPGETVTIDARVRDAEGMLTGSAAVTAAVTPPSGEGASVQLARSAEATGAYSGTYSPGGPGRYKVKVVATEEGRPLGEKELEFRVIEPSAEFDRLDLNEEMLKRLAEATGGRYATLFSLEELTGALSAHARELERSYVLRLADARVLFALFVALVTAEWIIRRGRQLG